jgi:hypothetical protein
MFRPTTKTIPVEFSTICLYPDAASVNGRDLANELDPYNPANEMGVESDLQTFHSYAMVVKRYIFIFTANL